MKGLLLITVATLAGMAWALAGLHALESTDGSASHPYQPNEVPPCSRPSTLAPRPSAPGTCAGMTYAQWLQYTPKVDARPFLSRLWDSLRASFGWRTDPVTGRTTLDRIEIRGGAEI